MQMLARGGVQSVSVRSLLVSKTSTLSLSCPKDFVLARDACSYGYFLLAPNAWDPVSKTLWRVLTLPGASSRAAPKAVLVHVAQPRRKGVLSVKCYPNVSRSQQEQIRLQLARMLRLDEDEQTIASFHAKDKRFLAGGQGRLLRSPTLFEDVIKTITSCNVQWQGTIAMNKQLCDCLGPRVAIRVPGRTVIAGFPTAQQLARARPAMLRARCRVGYRDTRIVEIAKLFATPPSRGGIDQAKLQDPATPDDKLLAMLSALPGVGPYAAANIMQLLGRYHRLPLDTESVAHGRNVLGLKGSSAKVMRAVKQHFAPFAEHAFRSYWFELREQYEAKHGPAHTWSSSNAGRVLTAALAPSRKARRSRTTQRHTP
jgi:3-methyladenine DNA glycosylase/8-oxoguanine DNA glycosylase